MAAAFFYVHGDPCKGAWVDLDMVSGREDVLEALAKEGVIPYDDTGIPIYDGELLVARAEGALAQEFLEIGGRFDLDAYIEARDTCYGESAAVAYIRWVGRWDKKNFYECYEGCYPSKEAFAKHLINDVGVLGRVSDIALAYFDYDQFARDLFSSDYYMSEEGHVFRYI